MDINEAKQLHLPDILARLGHHPVKTTKGGKELWYKSPFREDQDPSFHASVGRFGFWIWKDFADSGGTVIDFIMRYQNLSNASEALRFLNALFEDKKGFIQKIIKNDFVAPQSPTLTAKLDDNTLELLNVAPLSNVAILDYLKLERGIPDAISLRYLKEIQYRNKQTDKEYLAFGMENLKGGFEIRAASSEHVFKSALNGKDISVIEGMNPQSRILTVFEGMIDFLSFLVLTNCEHSPNNALILHSLSSFQKATEHILTKGYTTIYTCLDNNPAGLATTERFQSAFGDFVKPCNSLYAMYVDLNDALMDKASVQFEGLI